MADVRFLSKPAYRAEVENGLESAKRRPPTTAAGNIESLINVA